MKTKKEGMEKEVKKKEKGILLTAWLVLIFLSNLVSFLNFISNLEEFRDLFGEIQFYLFFTFSTFITLLALVSVIFIFLWKKWAFFSLVASYLFGAILTAIITPMGGFFSIIYIVLPIGILYILMEEKWEFFE